MSTYALSFTGSALRKAESLLLAEHFLETEDWLIVRNAAVENDTMMIHAISSRKRVASELIKRLKTLNADELQHLLAAAPTEQNLVLWLACCRAYEFAADFSREVIVRKFKDYSSGVSIGAFEAFYDEQSEIHPKLTSISVKTHNRLRSQFFQILREVGLLNENGQVQQVFISSQFDKLLEAANKDEYSLFPVAR